MGLRTILRKLKQKEKEVRVLLLGLDNAGKTTIIKKLMDEDIRKIEPTLGFAIHSLAWQEYQLNVWDVGGQKCLRSYWRNYFDSTDCLIWVVDSSNSARLNDCREELHKLIQEERLMGATLLILANKQDLPGSLPSEEIEKILNLSAITTHNWRIFPCSAVTGDNLTNAIDWITSDVTARIFSFE